MVRHKIGHHTSVLTAHFVLAQKTKPRGRPAKPKKESNNSEQSTGHGMIEQTCTDNITTHRQDSQPTSNANVSGLNVCESAVVKSAVLKLAVLKLAVLKLAVLKLAVLKLAVLKLAVLKSAVLKLAVLKSAVLKSAVLKSAVLKSAVLKSAVLKLAVLKSAVLKLAMPSYKADVTLDTEKFINSNAAVTCHNCKFAVDRPVEASCCGEVFCCHSICKWLATNATCPECTRTLKSSLLRELSPRLLKS